MIRLNYSKGDFEKALDTALKQFSPHRRRLSKLGRYYEGRHDILMRTKPQGMPNNRLPHGFPKYIAELSAGYMYSTGPIYSIKGDDEGLQNMLALEEASADAALNMRIALYQSVYGQGLSLCWLDNNLHISSLDPRNAFIAYDDTAARKPLFGVILSSREMRVYTDTHVYIYEGVNNKTPKTKAPHGFKRLPMVAYDNGPFLQGDFEHVLPLVDAYDTLASDRLNDRGQFADAMLVLTGIMGIDESDDNISAAAKLRQQRTLTLPDSDSKAEWLIKNANEKDIDVLRKAISDDIHKFSMTPDLEDTRLLGMSSGIAIQYKLFCLRQRTAIKERFFIKGLKDRAKLLCDVLESRGQKTPDVDKIKISFKNREGTLTKE